MIKLINMTMLICCISFYGYSQNLGLNQISEKNKKPFYIYFGGIKSFSAENSLGLSKGIDFERNNGWGIGMDLRVLTYKNPVLDGLPAANTIENLNGAELSTGIEKVFHNGEDDNYFFSASPNVFKVLNLNDTKSLRLFLNVGASIVYTEEVDYKVRYQPEVPGTFAGGGSSERLIYEINNNDKDVTVGLLSKISTRFIITKTLGIEFSTFGNLNREKSVYGFQFGVVLGRLK